MMVRSGKRARHTRGKMGRGTWTALVVFFLAAAVAAVMLLAPQLQFFASADRGGNATASSSVPATPETPSPPATPAALPAATGEPVAADGLAPQHLVYAAAGMDMAIEPLTPTNEDLASQSIIPPPTMDAYWLTSYGKPGTNSQNTTYIVGHSWEDREAPFNALSSAAAPGDTLSVATANEVIEYRVDSVQTHDKDTLKTSDIWDIVPGRLVLISCYAQDLWGKNIVVVATPVQK